MRPERLFDSEPELPPTKERERSGGSGEVRAPKGKSKVVYITTVSLVRDTSRRKIPVPQRLHKRRFP